MRLIFLTSSSAPEELLQMCELLGHEVSCFPLGQGSQAGQMGQTGQRVQAEDGVVVIDARGQQVLARNTALQLAASGAALLGLIDEAGFAAANASWPMHEWIGEGASAAELQARLLLCRARAHEQLQESPAEHLNDWGLEIDEGTYTVRVHGEALNLTYKEFELLKFLSSSPDQAFTREQLLSEVWGFDYYGGTRTVDVHVRRLRAKLGADHEQLIGTVRNVGYLFSSARP